MKSKNLNVSKAIDKAADYRLKAEVRRAAVSAVETAGLTLPNNSRWDWTTGEHAPGDKWWAEFRAWLPTLTDIDRKRVEGEIIALVQKSAGWFTSRDIYEVRSTATDSAREWAGWGTALKPAWEPIILARNPLSEPNVAANVLRWGTGALNIDGCRVKTDEHLRGGAGRLWSHYRDGKEPNEPSPAPDGRWPANLLLDEQSAAMLDAQTGTLTSGDDAVRRKVGSFLEHGGLGKPGDVQTTYGDSGGASRFFYTAKADRADRDGSKHPTIKPRDLCGYLVRLVTPPGGLVVDPFMGSGPIVWAAREYGFRVIGIERDRASCQDAVHRLRQKVLAL